MQVTGVLATRAANEQAGDTSTLDALLAGDFTAVGPLGFILPRQHGSPATTHATSLTRPSAPRKCRTARSTQTPR